MKRPILIELVGEQVVTVPESEAATLLDALYYVAGELEGGLAFRDGCRTGQCGVCAVSIDGEPRLACMAPVRPGNRYRITPILPDSVVQDLVCDVSAVYRRFFEQQPWADEHHEQQAFVSALLVAARPAQPDS